MAFIERLREFEIECNVMMEVMLSVYSLRYLLIFEDQILLCSKYTMESKDVLKIHGKSLAELRSTLQVQYSNTYLNEKRVFLIHL